MRNRPKYFRPTSNTGFHKIFCTEGNDALVIQLLNSIIDDRTITEIERLDPVHTVNIDTYSTFDLYCGCSDGSRVIVECQNRTGSELFMNRALAYSSMAILDQARARWKYDFQKVYFIGILNYVQFQDRPQAITKVMLQSLDDHIVTNDNYLQIFVELPKLPDDEDSEGTLFLRAVRDIGSSEERQQEYGHSGLDLLFKAADYGTLDNEEQHRYDKEMTTEEDTRAYIEMMVKRATKKATEEGYAYGMEKGMEKGMERGMEKGMEEGMEKGMEKGIAKGKAEANLETARKLKAAGVSIDIICQCTGLTTEQVK